MNSSFEAVHMRWDTFLGKIESRFHEMLSQSEALLPNVLEFQDFDPTPMNVAWQGIETQAKELISKIDDTWQEKVSPAFDEVRDAGEAEVEEADGDLSEYYEGFYKVYRKEQDKANLLSDKLERELKNYQVRTFAVAARKLQARASEELGKMFLCSQCKAPLPVRKNFFRSYYETCTYCQTVNTFEPGTIARQVEHFAVHAIAEEKALPEFHAYWDVEDKFKGQRDDEPQIVAGQTVLDAYTVYAEKYLKARIEIIPDLETQYNNDLISKVEHIRKWVLGEHGITNLSSGTTIDRALIEKIFWQIVEYHFAEEFEEIDEDTILGGYDDTLDSFMEDVQETFGIWIENEYEKPISQMIEYLDDHKNEIVLGENADTKRNWKSYTEQFQDEDDYDDE
jgi:hypothetical protein